MHVLHVVDSLGRGGAERQLVHVARQLHQRGVRQSVLHLFAEDSLAFELRALGARVHSLGLPMRMAVLPVAATLALRTVRRIRPTIISTQLAQSDVVGRLAAGALGIPAVSTWQNTTYASHAPLMRGRTGLVMKGIRGLDRATSRYASRFVAVSDAVRASYVEALAIAASRVVLIPNAVDLRDFPSGRASPLESRPVRIVHVGRHVAQKDVGTLLRAAARLPSEGWELILLGRGPESESLRRLSLELGLGQRVRFEGLVSNVRDFLLDADLFVLPSLHEGLPLALLEAFAAGLSAVASDIAPVREVDPQGDATLFSTPGDPQSLSKALLQAIKDRHGRAARAEKARTLTHRFDAQAVGDMYFDLFEEVAARPHGA